MVVGIHSPAVDFLFTYLFGNTSSFQKSCKNKSDTKNTCTVCPSLITSWAHFTPFAPVAPPPPHVNVCVCTLTQAHTCLVSLLCDSWLHSASPTMCQVYFVHKCFIMIGSGNSHSNPRHRCHCFHHFVDEKPGTQKGCITCLREYSSLLWDVGRLRSRPCSSVLFPARTSSAETFLWVSEALCPHGPHKSVFHLF